MYRVATRHISRLSLSGLSRRERNCSFIASKCSSLSAIPRPPTQLQFKLLITPGTGLKVISPHTGRAATDRNPRLWDKKRHVSKKTFRLYERASARQWQPTGRTEWHRGEVLVVGRQTQQ